MASALQVPGAHGGTGSRPGLWVSGPCGEVGRGLLLCWTGSAVQGTQSGSLVLSCQGTSACALTPGGRLCGRGLLGRGRHRGGTCWDCGPCAEWPWVSQSLPRWQPPHWSSPALDGRPLGWSPELGWVWVMALMVGPAVFCGSLSLPDPWSFVGSTVAPFPHCLPFRLHGPLHLKKGMSDQRHVCVCTRVCVGDKASEPGSGAE